MANTLKCPNPSCPYLFDPTSVPAGVVLACPRCGMRFTVGPAAAPAPPPAPPPPSPPPPVTPPPSTQPPAPQTREPVPAPPPPKRGGLGAIVLPVAAAVLIAGT